MSVFMRTAMVDGCRIHYRQAGAGAANILLLHGKSFTADTWHGLGTLSLLSEAGWRATAVDLPGAGRSDECHLAKGDFLFRFMDAARLPAALVVAPSYSGWYAFALLDAYPEKVVGFVGVAPRGIRSYHGMLHRVRVPVLAIWGENDDVVPLERADELVGAVPDGRKIIIAGGSHAPYLSDPHGFHAHLLAFARQCCQPLPVGGDE